MALPQRRDPNEERRLQDGERRRTVETEPAGGGFGWWWLWLLIIIAIIWFAGWGWGGWGGWWWGRPRTARVAPVNGTVNGGANGAANRTAALMPTGEGVAILNATNKAPFIGQPVDIRGVRVNNKVDNHALWIGTPNGNNANNASNNGAGVGANVGGVGANVGTNGVGAHAGNAGVGANAGGNGVGAGAQAGKTGAGANAGTNGAATGTAGTQSAVGPEVPTLVVLENAAAGTKNNAGGQGNNGGNKNATTNTTANGSLKTINNGELVNVIGTVEKAPPANMAEKQWGLDHGAAMRLERDGAYIRATQIIPMANSNR